MQRRFQSSVFATLPTLLTIVIAAGTARAESFRLSEPYTDRRTFSLQSHVTTAGKVLTAKVGADQSEMELSATVEFDFLSRRLPPAGRDAQAMRAARAFQTAHLATSVAGYQTEADLPEDRQLIVSAGDREGIVNYSPQGPLTRESVDLLDIPGDPLALIALLPANEVSPGSEWTPSDWVLQMLTGIEAVESSDLKCRLDKATPAAAKITFQGQITGQRLGTNTSVRVVGALIYNRDENYLSQAKTIFDVKSDVGTVNPGLEMKVTSTFSRQVVEAPGRLTDAWLESISLDAPPESFALEYQAAPWGMSLTHDRRWHLFQAVYDGGAPVAILRLVELGSLIAQCNLSPAPTVPAGEITPLSQFERDIERSLGERFGDITSREKIPHAGGLQIHRVTVSGFVKLQSEQGRKEIPMTWIYYLVSHPQGRQASFVFSVEPTLVEQLNNRDLELVKSLRFLDPPQGMQAQPTRAASSE